MGKIWSYFFNFSRWVTIMISAGICSDMLKFTTVRNKLLYDCQTLANQENDPNIGRNPSYKRLMMAVWRLVSS